MKESLNNRKQFFSEKFYIIEQDKYSVYKKFDGAVLKYTANNCEIIQNQESNSICFIADAGLSWDSLVRKSIKSGASGMENLADIPGTVGAAAVQNIGAYGTEQANFFSYLEAIDLLTGKKITLKKNDCEFGYRTSKFKKNNCKFLITKVCYELKLYNNQTKFNIDYPDLKYELEKLEEISPQIIYNTVKKIRNKKLPNLEELPNAGSFFKNPIINKTTFLKIQEKYPDIKFFGEGENIKISAAWLIEKCSWKGKRVKNSGTYKNHSLILVNYGDATGEEILQLSDNII